MTTSSSQVSRMRLMPMRPRDPQEPGRVASTLELFFDLVFVVAVSVAAAQLHHALTENHIAHGVLSYVIVFFAIWWAWMNFTWFATSFATDDWLYRVLTIFQMGGVLVLAAGIERVFADEDFRVVVVGYVVMRVSMIAQWLRASRSAPEIRRVGLSYAAGIAVVQVLWIALMFLPHEVTLIGWLILVIAEMAVPVVAERRGGQPTPWHPHHITERYGLFTLILLGESLLASANAIIEAVHAHEELAPLISISVLTLLVTAALWWIYFWPPHHHAITSFASSLRYGYVHFFVFAAAGAFSAGVEAQIDVITHHSKLSEFVASFTMTLPIAIFVLGIWWIALRANADRVVNIVVPLGAVLVLLDPIVPVPFIVTTVLMVAVVATLVIRPPVTVGGDQ
ncbi:low temperature requirement protein A [Kribbella sp. NPDC056951]|uniref:low temperature requirement protein A n=1 Tax=Kribbella sp. NPDC056951 TaxID=3345978 RepID=UPI00362F1749